LLGAAVYFIFRRRQRRKVATLPSALMLFLSLLFWAPYLVLSVGAEPHTIKPHVYSWPGHTGTANVWFTVDDSKCSIERSRCDLTGWISIGVYSASCACTNDAVQGKSCQTADHREGTQRCLSTMVLLMNEVGASIPYIGAAKFGSWEEGRTTISDCTPCCAK
jgi:hypothetical protein